MRIILGIRQQMLSLQQRQLFSSNNGTNDNNPSGTSQYLIRHSAPGQASLNMSDVLEEQEEGGDGDDSQ